MGQPLFIAEGTQARLRDSQWTVLCKQLGALQNAGGRPNNHPRRSDTKRILQQKILAARLANDYPGN